MADLKEPTNRLADLIARHALDSHAAYIREMLAQKLPKEVYESVFAAETLLRELYEATKGYRGDRMPLRADQRLNNAFANTKAHLRIKE